MSVIATRYRYASDTQEYIELERNKPVKLDKLRMTAFELGLTNDVLEADLATLKSLQMTRKHIATESRLFKRAETAAKSSQPSRNQLISDSYGRLRATLIERVKFHIKDESRITYYVNTSNEVYPCFKEDLPGFELLVMRHPDLHELLQLEFESDSNIILQATLGFDGYVSEIYKKLKFDMDCNIDTEPAPISWDPNMPAYKQLNVAILKPDPTPTWDQFTSRLDFADHFKAFVWSIFEPLNKGRQALYLYGAGFDGKSSAFNAIANVLGDRHTMSIDNEKLKNTQFFYGNVHGKRLVLYPDCKVTSVIRHEVIKSLLGGDKVQVNRKNRDAFNSSVHVKLMIGSNRYPRIDSSDKSERTRLMFLKVQPISDNRGDYLFESNLRAEIGPFLYQCKAAYERLCPTHSELELPAEMQANIRNECNSSDADSLEDFIDELLEFGPLYMVTKRDLDKALREYALTNELGRGSHSLDNLQVKMGGRNVTQKRARVNSARPNCFIGVRLKGTNLIYNEE